MSPRQPVAVVTGGGGGIGRAMAEELGRLGWMVVTVDPLVTLDGTAPLPDPAETTAGRIVAAGGTARASAVSVTDGPAVAALFQELVAEHGGLDAVVNVAGITRQSGFAHGTEEDWLALLHVHLGGYLNVLAGALPLMAAAGSGTILGVTSGSGWRAADAGGYSCAKRAVASLTWQLGRLVPAGVTVNAVSPIAATRMVAAALERARAAGRSSGGGGLSLSSMSGPEELGPIGAHFVGPDFRWCNGRVLFAGGSEVAVIDEPHLLEVVRTGDVVSLAAVLDAVIPRAFAPAEMNQTSDGATNPRFGPIFDEPTPSESTPSESTPSESTPSGPTASGPVLSCAVVSDRPLVAAAIDAALQARSIASHRVEVGRGFVASAAALAAVVEEAGPIDAVVVALAGTRPAGTTATLAAAATDGWERVLAEHDGIIGQIHTDAGWARVVADYAAEADRPVRLVTLTDGESAGGRSRAQAAAQLARVGAATTHRRVSAFAVSLEGAEDEVATAAGQLTAHLLGGPEASALAGAELVVGPRWLGLRGHPRPMGSITFGGPAVPEWLDDTIKEIVGR